MAGAYARGAGGGCMARAGDCPARESRGLEGRGGALLACWGRHRLTGHGDLRRLGPSRFRRPPGRSSWTAGWLCGIVANRERIPLLGSAFRAPRPRLAGCGDLERAGLHAQGRELETCGTKRGVGAGRGEPRGREAEKAPGSPRQSLCHAEESLRGLPLGLLSTPLLHRRN